MNAAQSLQDIAKERTVKTTSVDYDLETLTKKIKKGSIRLDPDYQRNHKWDASTSSKLIESLILNIPIPLIYISQDIDVDTESDDPMYSVIDGQQRLRAIFDFMENRFELSGLSALEAVNGMKYKDLPPFLIRRLEDRTVRCLRIDSSSDSQVKLDIFERLNSGSVKLTAQELRNATIRGKFNDLLKKLSKNEKFIQMINDQNDSKRVKGMYNYELILRLISLMDGGFVEYDGKMGGFLDRKMQQFSDSYSESLAERISEKFEKIMNICFDMYGKNAFSKIKNNKAVSSFNVAVYDSLTLGVEQNIEREFGKNEKSNFSRLFESDDFQAAISGSINDKSKLLARVSLAREALK